MLVKCSPSNSQYFRTGYPSQYDWTCYVQCGGSGKSTYFFEVCHEQGFIRADSKISIQDAEDKAWQKYQNLKNCKFDHQNENNLDRKQYLNGIAFCKACNSSISPTFSKLEPLTTCVKCLKPTYYTTLKSGEWCCEHCLQNVPEDQQNEMSLLFKNLSFKNE